MTNLKRKKMVLTFFTIFLFLLPAACSKLGPNNPEDSNFSAISASIKVVDEYFSVSTLDSMVLEVTGSGVETIKKTLSIDGTSSKVQLTVPAGKQLKFSATAYQAGNAVLRGSEYLTPKAGQSNSVQIKLNFLVPTIILSPPQSTIQVGNNVELYLAARNVIELGTFGAEVQFDPSKLKVVDMGREDTFLKSNSGSVNQLQFSKDNTTGRVKVVLGIFPASAAVTGSGNVGRIVFQALSAGVTDLSIHVDNSQDSDLGLFDKNANLMFSLGLGGQITVQ